MQLKNYVKKYWWVVIAVIWLVSLKIFVLDTFIELKRHKHILVEKERQIIPQIEECVTLEELNEKLNKIRTAKILLQNSQQLNTLLDEIINPAARTKSDVKFQYDLSQGIEEDTEIHYPINLEMESSFHTIGDYLEYLESSYLPVLINKITISPSQYEFDKIKAKLSGNLCLSK